MVLFIKHRIVASTNFPYDCICTSSVAFYPVHIKPAATNNPLLYIGTPVLISLPFSYSNTLDNAEWPEYDLKSTYIGTLWGLIKHWPFLLCDPSLIYNVHLSTIVSFTTILQVAIYPIRQFPSSFPGLHLTRTITPILHRTALLCLAKYQRWDRLRVFSENCIAE